MFRQEIQPLLKDIESQPQSSQQENITEARETVVKLYLGKGGVSEDQITWHDADQFADYLRQLQEKGVKEVQYSLLPDSIERIEKQWDAVLKKANMKNYIEAD